MPDGTGSYPELTSAKGIRLTERQRLNWLRLIRSENVGPATFKDLINYCGSAQRAIDMLPDLANRGGSRARIKIAGMDDAEKELADIEAFGARLIGIGEPEYPSALRQIPGAPPLLTMKGNFELVHRPMVAMVGARNASINGSKFAAKISRDLGNAGYVIASGLARGIDASAHRASRETGTLAALAGGLNQPYPEENKGLFEEICAGDGLAITEMPFNWKPVARDFPRRNRLIAGVALGLLVVEAAKRSGSLISARRATEFGRIVFAVPGSPLDPRAAGTNSLIQDGAILVTDAQDIIDTLSPMQNIKDINPLLIKEQDQIETDISVPDQTERAMILDSLSVSPVEIDDIIRHTGMSAQTVYLVLLELDLSAQLNRHTGGLVSLRADI